MFTETEAYWDWRRLSADLSAAKANFKGVPHAKLSETESKYLRGILCNNSPTKIAELCHVSRGTVASCLSEFVYRYIETLITMQGGEKAKVSDWHDVPLLLEKLGHKSCLLSDPQSEDADASSQSCWDGAPEMGEVFGRDALLAELRASVTEHKHRIILLTGQNGIGKTQLAMQLAHTLATAHQYSVYWQSMAAAPTLDRLLDRVQRLWGSQECDPEAMIEARLEQLISCLQSQPHLIVLDAMESILDDRKYKQSHRDYMDLFRRTCETTHPSCVLLTSVEPLHNIRVLRNGGFAVECVNVSGLDKVASRQLLQQYEIDCDDAANCDHLNQIYGGNPQFIKITAATIRNLCHGKLSEFTALDTIFIDEQVQDILTKTWQSLSEKEQAVALNLYRNVQGRTLLALKADLSGDMRGSDILKSLKQLKHRALIEAFTGTQVTYQLVPVVRRFLVDYLDI